MKPLSIRANISLDQDSYFLVQPGSGGSYTLTVTDGGGSPVHFRDVSRRQLYQLVSAVQKVTLLEDQSAAEKMLASATIDTY